MPDAMSVANAALAELGSDLITSIDGDDTLAVLCRTHYEDARDATLELARWPFATFYQQLVRSGIPPAFRWQYQYLVPTNPYCLTILDTDQGAGARWEVGADATQERVVFSDAPSMAVSYIGRVENLNQWSRLAVQVLIKLLASKLAKALTGQSGLEQQLLQEALGLVPAGIHHLQGQQHGGVYEQTSDTLEDLTETRLAQRALAELGHPPLQTIEEQTVLGLHCRTHLAASRDQVLEWYPWHFAKRQAVLEVSPITPAYKWAYQYRLPDRCLTVLETDTGAGDRWELGMDATEGRVLYSNASAVSITYVEQQREYTLWSALALDMLVKVLASKLAPALAMGLSQSLPGQATPEQLAAMQQQRDALLALGVRKWDEAQALLPVGITQQGAQVHEGVYEVGADGLDTPTALRVVQRALGELGQPPLNDLQEATVRGLYCRTQLAAAREQVLELHPWNFAKRQAVLEVSTTTPAFAWQYQYRLPEGCLTVLGTDQGNGARWEIGIDATDGKVLYSNEEAVSIAYIATQPALDLWSALALDVLVKVLASKLAPALAVALAQAVPMPATPAMLDAVRRQQQPLIALGARKWEEAQLILAAARDRDAREGFPIVLRANTVLTRARHRWGGRILEGLVVGESSDASE